VILEITFGTDCRKHRKQNKKLKQIPQRRQEHGSTPRTGYEAVFLLAEDRKVEEPQWVIARDRQLDLSTCVTLSTEIAIRGKALFVVRCDQIRTK
jgi:hypothetical protein